MWICSVAEFCGSSTSGRSAQSSPPAPRRMDRLPFQASAQAPRGRALQGCEPQESPRFPRGGAGRCGPTNHNRTVPLQTAQADRRGSTQPHRESPPPMPETARTTGRTSTAPQNQAAKVPIGLGPHEFFKSKAPMFRKLLSVPISVHWRASVQLPDGAILPSPKAGVAGMFSSLSLFNSYEVTGPTPMSRPENSCWSSASTRCASCRISRRSRMPDCSRRRSYWRATSHWHWPMVAMVRAIVLLAIVSKHDLTKRAWIERRGSA